MYALIQRDIHAAEASNGDGDASKHDQGPDSKAPTDGTVEKPKVPAIFLDPGYNLLGTSVLSTSNCGNPALRLFGFGPVTPEGYGIGTCILLMASQRKREPSLTLDQTLFLVLVLP